MVEGKLVLIAAVAENGVIGLNGEMPWRLKKELKMFREFTMGHGVVMGRNTAQSLERARAFPLDGRYNVVISTSEDYNGVWDNVMSTGSLSFGLEHAGRHHPDGIAHVIGGGQIYAATINMSETIGLRLTRVHQSPQGDTYFPQDYEGRFRLVGSEPYLDLGYTIETWEKI